MGYRKSPKSFLGFWLIIVAICDSAAWADDLYAPPSFDEVEMRTLQWVAERNITDENILNDVATLWAADSEKPTAQELLDTVVWTFSLVDPDTKRFVQSCVLLDAPLRAPDANFLFDDGMNDHYAINMRLFYARYLTQRKMFDEALPVFDNIDPGKIIDPASCLYFKAVCEHQLLLKKEGLKTIESLLKNTEAVPIRYSTVATLMQYDLEALKEKSLDVISREMRDSKRRLALARSGSKAQKVQDEIIAGLDEIIEKIEQQAGGGSGDGGGMGGNTNNPGGGASDSSVKGATAPGNVDKKNFKSQGGWGDLNPKQQAKAKNEIRFKFPAHYEKQNNEYFKKLAKRKAR